MGVVVDSVTFGSLQSSDEVPREEDCSFYMGIRSIYKYNSFGCPDASNLCLRLHQRSGH